MNNVGSALNLLNRYRPTNKSDEVDLRGWEWRYLWNQCQSDAESVFCKTQMQVMSLSVSHDGAWLALGTGDTGVSIRDLATRQEIASFRRVATWSEWHFPRENCCWPIRTCPATGPPAPITAFTSGMGSARQIVRTLPLSYHCYGVAFSEDGRTLVTSTQNPDNNPLFPGSITLWRVSDGSIVTNYPAPQFGMGEGTSVRAGALI